MADEQTPNTPDNTEPTPTTQSTPQAAPAPTPPPQSSTPAQPGQVQYIVTERSLNGVGGWLIFWIIIFSIMGIGFVVSFFNAIDTAGYYTDAAATSRTLLLIFAPLLGVGYLASTVLIALRKKLGQTASIATLGVTALYSVISALVAAGSAISLGATAGGILASLIFFGLMILYFVVSKRVKQTLVR